MNPCHLQQDTLSLLKAGKLQGSKRLKLCCNLTDFPAETFTLADTLEILDLSGNLLNCLPDDLNKLHKLRILFCSSNQFTHVPEVLGQCENLSMIGFKANKIAEFSNSAIPAATLRWLILTDNALTKLPDGIGDCQHMQKLMLAGNQLNQLPESLVNCKKLELLRISANRFDSLPEWLFDLPKLSWLAYAGNPFSDSIEKKLISTHHIPKIDWHRLKIQQQLGEGASGLIYQAQLQLNQPQTNVVETSDVAVKMFKADLTSDGLPRCEIHATALAGQHPNLLGLVGITNHHPHGESGMLIPLLNANLTVLANPPDFESCSRDIYADNTEFPLTAVLNIAYGIASAVAHLHASGITHGDLYAHNILFNQHKNSTLADVVLTDFGAASFLPPDNFKQSQQLQRIESHAFACLLEELLNHCALNVSAADNDILKSLWQLQTECAQTNSAERPLFEAVKMRIEKIKSHQTN
ncbi:MAG: leucine-rich repeat-containing protein kinase family protein [Pseudomonadota bacterium]